MDGQPRVIFKVLLYCPAGNSNLSDLDWMDENTKFDGLLMISGQGYPPSYAQSPPFGSQPPPNFQAEAASGFNSMYGSAGQNDDMSPTGMEGDNIGSFSEKSIRLAFVR